jgi:hypothetical protein
MPEPGTTPTTPEKPGFQPGTPTPEDPRQNEPIHDPPVDPEHDDVERVNPVRQAGVNEAANEAALRAARRHEMQRMRTSVRHRSGGFDLQR